MADVQAADLIAVINAATCWRMEPMMALAVRQAWRKGAKVYLVGDTPCRKCKMIFPLNGSVATPADIPI